MSGIDRLLGQNERYAVNFSGASLPAAPACRLAIVTCMDARLETGRMLGLREGDAHVMRNAGGVVTEDVLRSLTVSQRLLGTREVMVIQHTDCGMQKFDDAEVERSIESETGAPPPFSLGAFSDLETTLRQSVERIRSSPFLPHREAVRGFVYEVETGRMRELV